MKQSLVVLLLLCAPAMVLADPNPATMYYDRGNEPSLYGVWVNFTAASDDTINLGVSYDVVSLQESTADLKFQPLGDPSLVINDKGFFDGSKVANTRAGEPRIYFPVPHDLAAGNIYDIPGPGVTMLRILGNGSSGTVFILCSKGAGKR